MMRNRKAVPLGIARQAKCKNRRSSTKRICDASDASPERPERCPNIGAARMRMPSFPRHGRLATRDNREWPVRRTRPPRWQAPFSEKVPQKWRWISKSLRATITFRVWLPASTNRCVFPQVADGRFRPRMWPQAPAVYFSKSSATFGGFHGKAAGGDPTDPRRRDWRGR